jgi:sortase A
MTAVTDTERTDTAPPRAPKQPKPPKAPKPPRSARPPKPPRGAPRPPRRIPLPPPPRAPLSRGARAVRATAAMFAIILLGFVVQVTLVSHLQHAAAQQQAGDVLRKQLTDGTAPVSEGDVDGHLLAEGAPVAILEIPSIKLYEVVVEGTTPGALMSGPGHRRDTVLPGQQGVSVLFGRAAAYGGPFGGLQSVPVGAEIIVTTGQGRQVFTSMGIRYAGETAPASPQSGQSRLILESARGLPYIPSGVVYLDAELTGAAQPAGLRATTFAGLPDSAKLFGVDTSTLWALVFALQLLIAAEVALLWALPRVGWRKAWIAFTPIFLLGGLWASVQLTLLLPNLL